MGVQACLEGVDLRCMHLTPPDQDGVVVTIYYCYGIASRGDSYSATTSRVFSCSTLWQRSLLRLAVLPQVVTPPRSLCPLPLVQRQALGVMQLARCGLGSSVYQASR